VFKVKKSNFIPRKDPTRLMVLERIAAAEAAGTFDVDVEDDIPSPKVELKNVDFLKNHPMSGFFAHIATKQGQKFQEGILKRGEVVFGPVVGRENVDGFWGGAVITCNHVHIIDNYCVNKGLAPSFYKGGNKKKVSKRKARKNFILWKVVKESNWYLPPPIGWFVRHAFTLPISTTNLRLTAGCVKATKTLLERGEKVLVYPEQSMWWMYRRPRPLKNGAFLIAARARVPIIPCFIELRDTNAVGVDGFPVQEFILHVMPLIRPDENLTEKENAEKMRLENEKCWKKFDGPKTTE